ncbi:hypothetical protein EIG96_15965 [Staphylococcus aureus]|nr:hypothetical protein EIG96_15965 [Staphylococcus aureus]
MLSIHFILYQNKKDMHQHVSETNPYYLNNEIESNLKNVFTNRNYSIQGKIAKSDPRNNISRKKFHNSIIFNI